MRSVIYIISIVSIISISCSQNKQGSKGVIIPEKEVFEAKGQISLENGEGVKIDVPYEFVNEEHFSKFTSQLSREDFEAIVNRSSMKSKLRCKYELTYIPTLVELMVNNDTTTVIFRFHAKNAFGVPDELTSYLKFKGTNFIEQF